MRKTKKPIESGRALERTRATELMVPVPSPACVMTEMPVESIRSPKRKMSARVNMVPVVVLNLRPAARDGRKRRRGEAGSREAFAEVVRCGRVNPKVELYQKRTCGTFFRQRFRSGGVASLIVVVPPARSGVAEFERIIRNPKSSHV